MLIYPDSAPAGRAASNFNLANSNAGRAVPLCVRLVDDDNFKFRRVKEARLSTDGSVATFTSQTDAFPYVGRGNFDYVAIESRLKDPTSGLYITVVLSHSRNTCAVSFVDSQRVGLRNPEKSLFEVIDRSQPTNDS